MSENADLLVRKSTLHAIWVVAKAVIIINVSIYSLAIGVVERRDLLTTGKMFRLKGLQIFLELGRSLALSYAYHQLRANSLL
jgi:hypothetical protein